VGGKTRTDSDGKVTTGWDHDPPAKEKLVPFGILMLAAGALMLLFGSAETSDSWVDALQMWWLQVRASMGHVKRLVIYLDNGPKNSGRRTQFLKRMVQFADWSGLEIRLVYYPPYHSKYNPIERCWGILEEHWDGSLLDSVDTVIQYAKTMVWKGSRPVVELVTTTYRTGVKLTKEAMDALETQFERLPDLSKWFVDILFPTSCLE